MAGFVGTNDRCLAKRMTEDDEVLRSAGHHGRDGTQRVERQQSAAHQLVAGDRGALELGERAQRVAYACTAYGNWFAFAILGVVAPATGFPLKTATPDLPPPAAWANAVVGLGLAVTTLTLFPTRALLLYGLRATTTAREAA